MSYQTDIFRWSIEDNDPNGNPLKTFPPPEIVNTGLLEDEPWPRLWHNQAFNNYGLWIEHLAGFATDHTGAATDGGAVPVGMIKIVAQTAGITAVNAGERWGGTWTRTTDTVGGVSVHVFEKTAL